MKATLSSILLAGIVMFHTAALAVVVELGTGVNAAAITPARDAFRNDLGGGMVAGANGSFGGLRREINWDGVPDALSAPNNLPANFFNVNSPRGVVFATPGTGFQVSANSGMAPPIEFGNIDPTYPSTFAAFSAPRLFTPLGSNVVDVLFFVPGTNTPATVRGFGSVFTDVDLPGTTTIEYFAPDNTLIEIFAVPATPGSETLSFLGVVFDAGERVARVRITNGNTALGAGVTDQNGALRDLVVMDDFLYSEPQAIPEPASMLMVTSGLALSAMLRGALRRRARPQD